MSERTEISRYQDAADFEKLAQGHDLRAGLNESQSKHGALSRVERELHAELATLNGQMAAKYRALARAQTTPETPPESIRGVRMSEARNLIEKMARVMAPNDFLAFDEINSMGSLISPGKQAMFLHYSERCNAARSKADAVLHFIEHAPEAKAYLAHKAYTADQPASES